MKNTPFFLILFFIYTCFAQEKTYNFDLENIKDNRPIAWEDFGSNGYKLSIDKIIFQHGKNSITIEYNGNEPNYRAWAYSIPAKYQGKRIKVTGFVKTENVTDGYAGIWMRIDPSIAFDNMNNRGITGTTDWKKYEIELDLKPKFANQIVIGGLLVGKGKVWVDNFHVTIDGKTLEEVPLKELPLATKDHQFDNGSNISITKLDKQRIDNLELLGEIWGFLKYHHPAIAKGNYNWDYELFRMLPKYLEHNKPLNRDAFLLKWIESIGKIEVCNTCKETTETAYLKPDMQWIKNFSLSEKLKTKLHYMYKNRHQGNHYYISMTSGAGNPVFTNENPYGNMPYPDDGFRLLAVYKYWNMIHYYFPYKHLIDKNWNNVLKEYIPKFLTTKNELDYERIAVKLIGDIKDTHANLWGGGDKLRKVRGELFSPIHVRFIEDKLVITDYYNPELQEKISLQIGDVITKINGKTIAAIVKERLPFYPASNYPTQLRNISENILQSNSKSIQLSYIRNKKELSKELPLFKRENLKIYHRYKPEKDSKSFKLLKNNIGYITLKNIKEEDIPNIKEQFKNTIGIIIDIRNYPSTFVPFSLGSFFTSKTTPFVKFATGNINNPREFPMTESLKIPSDENFYKGNVIVIVNEISQSQAEYTTMAFRAGDNVTVIGSTTAGADGNISTIYLPGNLRTVISGIAVLYPDGSETQRKGIVPDIVVKPTVEGIRKGKDELLEKAVELLNKKENVFKVRKKIPD